MHTPHLTGLRVRAIPSNDDKTSSYFVVYVPTGSTAYQASDYRYYGRSEYEAKALPDHEVRLRMFRGKEASAIIQFANISVEDIDLDLGKERRITRLQEDDFWQKIRLHPGDRLKVKKYSFDVILKNSGGINITEFKAKIDFLSDNYSYSLRSYENTFKDGWLQDSPMAFLPSTDKSMTVRPMRVNIYPQDFAKLNRYNIYILENEQLLEKHIKLQWKIYLSHTLPNEGDIDVGKELSLQVEEV